MRLFPLAALFALGTTQVSALPVSFDFNAGPLIFAATGDPFAPAVLADFILGEDIWVTVSLEDSTPGIVTGTTITYTDLAGTISLAGAISGTIIAMIPGVELELQNNNEFDVVSPFIPGPKIAHEFALVNDTDYRTNVDFLSDPSNLITSANEIDALFVSGVAMYPNLSSVSTGEVDYFDTEEPSLPGTPIPESDWNIYPALEFGPVASVPVPPALPLLAGAIGLTAFLRRRNSQAS